MAAPIELRVGDGGMRWLIQPYAAVELWRGPRLLGTLSGASLCRLVEHYLAEAALAAVIQAELARPEPPLLAPPPAKPPAKVLPPPAKEHPVPAEVRAALRRSRRRLP